MGKWKIKAIIEVDITEEDIDDIVCAALEGGVNYWCNQVRTVGERLGEYASDQISLGGELEFRAGGNWHTLNKEKLLKGIQMYVERSHSITITEDTRDGLRLDTCQVDTEVADVVIQYALFGEIVYG